MYATAFSSATRCRSSAFLRNRRAHRRSIGTRKGGARSSAAGNDDCVQSHRRSDLQFPRAAARVLGRVRRQWCLDLSATLVRARPLCAIRRSAFEPVDCGNSCVCERTISLSNGFAPTAAILALGHPLRSSRRMGGWYQAHWMVSAASLPCLVCDPSRSRGMITVTLGGIVSLVTVYVFTPPWWRDPILGVERFFQSNLTRGSTTPFRPSFSGMCTRLPTGHFRGTTLWFGRPWRLPLVSSRWPCSAWP